MAKALDIKPVKSKEGNKPSFLPNIDRGTENLGTPRTPNKLQAAISRGSSLASAGSAYSTRSSLCSNCRTVCRVCSRTIGAKKEAETSKVDVKKSRDNKRGVDHLTVEKVSKGSHHGCRRCGYVDSPLLLARGKEPEILPRALEKPEPSPRSLKVSSPLHSYGKQRWIELLVDPKTTSLPMPTLPPIKEKKCSVSDALFEKKDKKDKKEKKSDLTIYKLPPCDFKVRNDTPKKLNDTPKKLNDTPKKLKPLPHQFPALAIQGNATKFHSVVTTIPGEVPPGTAPPPSSEMNTLPLVYNRQAKKFMTVDPLPGSIFSQCPEPGGWYVVHPDWRLEPGIKGMWSL